MAPRSKQYDVIVVGMGPAGASAAYELSRAGLSVLGFDKQSHPRYKVCGGGLSARIERILPPEFKQIVEETVYHVQFTYGGDDSFFIESPQPIAYMVMRSQFDKWLLDRARKAGTTVCEEEAVVEVVPLTDGIEVVTKEGSYQGRVVIGADGAMSQVAHQLFPDRRLRKIPALESETKSGQLNYQGKADLALISLSAAKKGYGWIFPKRNGLSIGVGEFVIGANRPKRSFQQFSRQEPLLKDLRIPSPLGHPLPVFNGGRGVIGPKWNGGLVSHRAVLVGDAGHLVDPLLGEGIFYAVRSGQLAARNIVEFLRHSQGRLEDYETAVRQEFGLEFRIASRLSRIIYGLPRSWHHWLGQTFPDSYQHVLHRYCQLLQGRETYQTLWARILRRLKGPFATRVSTQ